MNFDDFDYKKIASYDEKKLEELRKKNAKATDEVVEDVKDVDVPTAKA